MIEINGNRGFQITFENGWTVSVQIGRGCYCANKDSEGDFNTSKPSPNAEIAAFKNVGNDRFWYDFGTDTVKGWCKPDEILEFMNMVSHPRFKGRDPWKEK
tara:strand:- start:44 stop:346 length:303 start_codon:yes stop_codon:yes gene_type:complete